MLKLEKIAKTLEVSITLRPRSPLFSGLFLKALAMALGLHLLGVLIFTIQRINTTDNLSLFAPIYVESEITLNNHVMTALDAEEIIFRYMQEPIESKPTYPSLVQSSLTNELAWHSNPWKKQGHRFASLENTITTPSIPLSIENERVTKPITLEISGELKSYPLLNEGWGNNELSSLKKLPLNDCFACYEVRVDLQTGSIFWFQPQCECKSKKFMRVAEQILTNMLFHVSDSSKAIASGSVEIAFIRRHEGND